MSTEQPITMGDRPLAERFPDVMVDTETTGLAPDRNAIIQISAWRFNLAELTIDHNFFDRCLVIPNNRFWDEETRNWWLKQKRDVLMGILSRGEQPGLVMQDFTTWVNNDKAVFWGKPTHFDHSFISSYFKDYGIRNPFHFRAANDMNSFIRARYFPDEAPKWEWELPFKGPKHNAVYDALHQIATLFEVVKDTTVSTKNNFDKLLDARDKALEDHVAAHGSSDNFEADVPF